MRQGGRMDTQKSATAPWERWGWLMAAIWLVFLGFPLRQTAGVETLALRVTTVAAILSFAVVYLMGMLRVFQSPPSLSHRSRIGILLLLVTLAGVTAFGIGTEALALAPFVIASVVFALPVRTGLILVAAILLATLLLPLLVGRAGNALQFFAISALVTVATVVPRVLGERDEEYQDIAQELRLVAERERLARDVHDVLGHSLTVVSVKAELAERLLESDPQRAAAEVREIQSLTRQALAEVRTTVAGLRVARLDTELDSARAALRDAGIEVQVRGAVAEVDPRHRIATAWVVREAVTNIVRHSGARQVRIEMDSGGARVIDDGGGTLAPAGNGLRGLRERVEGSGGRFEVRAGAGPADRPGTLVEVIW